MIWNEAKECMSRDEMQNLQSVRLRKLVDYVYHNVEFYRKKMQALGLLPGDIKGIEDIEKAKEPLYSTKKDEERSGLGFTIMEFTNIMKKDLRSLQGVFGISLKMLLKNIQFY